MNTNYEKTVDVTVVYWVNTKCKLLQSFFFVKQNQRD